MVEFLLDFWRNVRNFTNKFFVRKPSKQLKKGRILTKKGRILAKNGLKMGLKTRFSGVTRDAGTAFRLRSWDFLSNFFEDVYNFVHLKLILLDVCSIMKDCQNFSKMFMILFT